MIFAIDSGCCMKRTLRILLLSLACCLSFSTVLRGQGGEYDVFVPISKYLSQGDVDKLSAWFADNLDVTIDEWRVRVQDLSKKLEAFVREQVLSTAVVMR